uniref:Leucine-rich repeat-containing protein 57 n=1 Tax=Daphnia galeata TaxID=27404 RepID=A0A8J2RSM6_9CRUS|nr:unnamed protein product [Daphnia galeata]
MGNSGLKQHLENSSKTGVFQLKDANLSELPPELLQIAQTLRTLDLSGNKIEQLPSKISSFNMLKHLTLNKNRLGIIPSELGQLTKLETLILSSNRLTSIPATLSKLRNLKLVNLSDNRLTTFPLEFCDMKHLDVLDLSMNKMTEVPTGVGKLQVVELNLNQNQIQLLSDELAECQRLKTLRLEENCLQIISSTILKESSISLLAVDGNLFDSKDFMKADGYTQYMERYTATKKKMY